jgi:putative addiction module component (TIGR02574 family)
MGKTLMEIENDIKELTISDKEILAHKLFEEIESINPDNEKAWANESERRLQELIDGKVKGIPAEEVFAELRQALNEKRNLSSSRF